MKILTERQYAEAINEAIDRFIERRDVERSLNRLRDVEEQLKYIRTEIDEMKSRISRIEELERKVAKTHADIVRCIDCRWWSDKNGGFCDILGLNINDEEFFCAWGEQRRKADGDGK